MPTSSRKEALSDSDIYPVDTIVRLLKTNEFAIVRQHTFQYNGKGFLNYLVEMEGKQGLYCVFHDAIELEHLP